MTSPYATDFRLSFGKHKGSLASQLPAAYATWLRANVTSPSLRADLAALDAEMRAVAARLAVEAEAGGRAARELHAQAIAFVATPSALERLDLATVEEMRPREVPPLRPEPRRQRGWGDGRWNLAWVGSRSEIFAQAVRLVRADRASQAQGNGSILFNADHHLFQLLLREGDAWRLEVVEVHPNND